MVINVDQPYFISGIHFNKKPEELGLVAQSQGDNLFTRASDQSTWKKTTLYDYGWGGEAGFARQPELGFDELWYLLFTSMIQDNVYGAAAQILQEYPEQMLTKVEELMNQGATHEIAPDVRNKLLILTLNRPINRSNIMGKSPQQIQDDYERWKAISRKLSITEKA